MLILPMRSQDSSPNRQSKDSCTTSLPARHQVPLPQTSELRKQVTGAMLSVMPSTRPSALKRPKLSLQTAIPPSPPTQRLVSTLNLSTSTVSPTIRNTHANTFEAPPATPSSAIQPHVTFPSSSATSSSTTSTSSSSGHSPFPHGAPYVLPIGTHSILRNSPLPRRHASATLARPLRRMFPPVKRVAFQENLVELVPTPLVEESSPDAETIDAPVTENEQQKRREVIEAQDGHATPVQGRRKRRREWVWRPLDDDVLITHDLDNGQDNIQTPMAESQLGLETGKYDVPGKDPFTSERDAANQETEMLEQARS